MENKIRLKNFNSAPPPGVSKKGIRLKTKELVLEIGRLQNLLYADRNYAVLVVLQGMDASGKDGAIRGVFSQCSPIGTWAYGFKAPSTREREHDFLWRVHKITPRKGRIQIFNRSHYEDILIQRVEKWITQERVEIRMNAINAFEKLLRDDNNTLILKYYMHISKEMQREKLQQRLDQPEKQWKHNEGDWEAHRKWDDYMQAYEYIFNNSDIPWNIVPCDKRWYRDYFIAHSIYENLVELDLNLPKLVND